MIRTLLALNGALVRGALALLLASEDDIRVVAEIDSGDELEPAIWAQQADVAVVDLELIADRSAAVAEACPLLVLADPSRPRGLHDLLNAERTIGVLGKDVTPQRVVDAVRGIAQGETVIDADVVAAALDRISPLTARELDVLDVAALGSPIPEIAATLGMAPGTVRNHLCRIMRKAGARTRIEAVRVARDSGWI